MTAEQYEAEKQAYVALLLSCVKGLLRWSDARASAWVKEFAAELATNPKSFIMHYPVENHVAAAAVPDSLREHVSGLERNRLRKAIERAILNGENSFSIGQTDWAAARERVNRVLAEYGERLPE
jgi:hypothetical protein